MLKVLFGNNWAKSQAHLLMLTKFKNGNDSKDFGDDSYWHPVLGESPQSVITMWVKNGILKPASLHVRAKSKFGVRELREVLVKNGLKVSGNKDALIKRLIENNSQEIESITKDREVYSCTDEGLKIVKVFEDNQIASKQKAENFCMEMLSKGRYKLAARIAHEYEAKQVFSRGIGSDWKSHNCISEVEGLKIIMTKTPKLLAGIDKTSLALIRVGAGMSWLFGSSGCKQWLPKVLDTGIHLNAEISARMLTFHVSFIRIIRSVHDQNDYNTLALPYSAEILSSNDSRNCKACNELNGIKFKIKDVPELPYEKCTCESGCRCTVGIQLDL